MNKFRTGVIAGGVVLLVVALLSPGMTGGLTSDDRAAWQEMRRTVRVRAYWLVVLPMNSTRWQSYTPRGLTAGAPGVMFVEEDGGDRQAEQFARNFLRNPGNSVAAVCDVYGGESPAPVEWLWAGGGEVKASPHPPEPWMDASLRRYLQVLQKEVVRWRKPPD